MSCHDDSTTKTVRRPTKRENRVMNGFPSEEENPREITIQRKSLQRNETQRK